MPRSASKNKSKQPPDSKYKSKPFKINMKVIPTSELFILPAVHSEMTMSDLKDYCELITGIPKFMQRLRYLDEGDLLDDTTLKDNEIVPGCCMHMTVWSMWISLLQAIAMNDLDWLMKLGVCSATDYKTPNLEYMFSSKRKEIFDERGEVGLFMAANRGRVKMIEALLHVGVDVNGSTTMGRTALHVAAAQNHGGLVDILLDRGADVDAEDYEGKNALTIASAFGHKDCEQHLFMFRWQERAKRRPPAVDRPDFTFQKFDSGNPVWLAGKVAQMYVPSDLLKPQEFAGSSLGSPRSNYQLKKLEGSDSRGGSPSSQQMEEDRDGQLGVIPEEGGMSMQNAISSVGRLSFATWLGKKRAKEEIELKKLREERQAMKVAEEDKRRKELKEIQAKKAEEMKAVMAEMSYDQWAAEKEAANKKQKKDAKVQAVTGGKTTKEVIHSLLLKQKSEDGYHGLPFEIWSADRTGKMFHQIKTHGDLLSQHYEVIP